MGNRLLVLLALALAGCTPSPLEPTPLKCIETPIAVIAGDTAWMSRSPIVNMPCVGPHSPTR